MTSQEIFKYLNVLIQQNEETTDLDCEVYEYKVKQRTVLVVMSRTRTHNTRSRKRQKTNPPSGDSNIPGEQSDAIVEEATGIDPVPEQPNPEPESSSDSAEHCIVANQATPAYTAEGAAVL